MGTAAIERTSDERGLALPVVLSIAVHAGASRWRCVAMRPAPRPPMPPVYR